MGIELWFKEDIRNILIATNVSSAATAGDIPDPAVQVYRRGYQAAIVAIGWLRHLTGSVGHLAGRH